MAWLAVASGAVLTLAAAEVHLDLTPHAPGPLSATGHVARLLQILARVPHVPLPAVLMHTMRSVWLLAQMGSVSVSDGELPPASLAAPLP
jgi:hypothetical protein